MEEKLYFKPANYGKGKKKERAEQKTEPKEKGNYKVPKVAIFLLFLASIVIIIIWLLHGKTTTTGHYPENIRNESLTCNSANAAYSPIGETSPVETETKVSMVFYGTDKLASIDVRHTLVFGSNGEAYSAEAFTHAEFGKKLASSGYSFEEFNNKFSIMDEKLIITLHAFTNDVTDESAPYLFISSPVNELVTLADYQRNFEKQGFECNSSLDNN